MARIQRGDVSALVLPDEVSEVILRGVAEQSLIMKYGKARPMRRKDVTLTEAEVTGANVFWVGEGARKSTDAPTMAQLSWTMSAGELAVIIPLDEDVESDADVSLFDLYKPAIETAIARKLDAAAIFGVDSPAAWGADRISIVEGSEVVGHTFSEDASPTTDELLDLILGTGADPADGAFQAVEDDGYEPSAALAYIRFKSRLRGLKDADGRYIFGGPAEAGVPGTLSGVPLSFAKSEIWTPADASLIVGDFQQALVGTRQGIRYKLFDQGVITDGSGNVVYSLMEQDMVALRVTARYGFKILADDTAVDETLADGSTFPFAVVRPLQAS